MELMILSHSRTSGKYARQIVLSLRKDTAPLWALLSARQGRLRSFWTLTKTSAAEAVGQSSRENALINENKGTDTHLRTAFPELPSPAYRGRNTGTERASVVSVSRCAGKLVGDSVPRQRHKAGTLFFGPMYVAKGKLSTLF